MAGVVSGRMNINPKYMIYHDLIGFYAYAKSISKLKLKNFTEIGEVIDESKNTFKIESEDGIATVAIPPELRLTERLVSFLHAAVQQRGLELLTDYVFMLH